MLHCARYASFLCALWATGCLIHSSPPPPQPQPIAQVAAPGSDPYGGPAQTDEPDAGPPPPPPSSNIECAAAGPHLAQLTRTALPKVTPARQSHIWIYKTGAWQRYLGDELVDEGCLSEDQRDQVESLIASADLTPPPPPQIQCAAVPTSETTIELPPRGGAVTYSGPCGKQAHPSIYAIEQALRDLIGGDQGRLFP